MISISTVAGQLVTALQAAGYRAYDHVPDSIVVPAVVVGIPTVGYAIDMSNDAATTFTVHVIVAKTNEPTAYRALDWALSAVPVAVETVGVHVQATRARVQPIVVGAVDYLAAVIDVEVYG